MMVLQLSLCANVALNHIHFHCSRRNSDGKIEQAAGGSNDMEGEKLDRPDSDGDTIVGGEKITETGPVEEEDKLQKAASTAAAADDDSGGAGGVEQDGVETQQAITVGDGGANGHGDDRMGMNKVTQAGGGGSEDDDVVSEEIKKSDSVDGDHEDVGGEKVNGAVGGADEEKESKGDTEGGDEGEGEWEEIKFSSPKPRPFPCAVKLHDVHGFNATVYGAAMLVAIFSCAYDLVLKPKMAVNGEVDDHGKILKCAQYNERLATNLGECGMEKLVVAITVGIWVWTMRAWMLRIISWK